jgi:hypothetical protein
LYSQVFAVDFICYGYISPLKNLRQRYGLLGKRQPSDDSDGDLISEKKIFFLNSLHLIYHTATITLRETGVLFGGSFYD